MTPPPVTPHRPVSPAPTGASTRSLRRRFPRPLTPTQQRPPARPVPSPEERILLEAAAQTPEHGCSSRRSEPRRPRQPLTAAPAAPRDTSRRRHWPRRAGRGCPRAAVAVATGRTARSRSRRFAARWGAAIGPSGEPHTVPGLPLPRPGFAGRPVPASRLGLQPGARQAGRRCQRGTGRYPDLGN